ncbi:MAG: hypothetical protein NC099_05985, partial [Corallococcus sp.]|nr:hypothetical protein [Corallococcus sp.]
GYVRKRLAQPNDELIKTYSSDGMTYYVAQTGEKIALSADGAEWYDGKLTCNSDGCLHDSPDCYGFIWYLSGSDYGDYATGVTEVIANYTIGNIKNISSIINKLTLSDVLTNIPDMLNGIKDETIGNLQNAITNLYLGSFLNYQRKLVEIEINAADIITFTKDGKTTGYLTKIGGEIYLSDNGKTWYEGKFVCANDEHDEFAHNRDCYSYEWYEDEALTKIADGVTGKLADKKVSELNSLNGVIQTLTIRDVLGNAIPDILQSVADTPLSGLNDAIQNMYIGELLEYERTPDCGLNHEHADDCYVWYDKNGNKASGMFAKMSDIKISELNKIDEKLKTFTLSDVLGDVPDILGSIKDEPIGNLQNAITNMYLGDFLNYQRKLAEIEVNPSDITTFTKDGKTTGYLAKIGGEIYLSEDGKNWYEGKFVCSNGEHGESPLNRDCYSYAWYTDSSVTADGVLGKLADKKVNELNSLGDTIQTFTIKDVLGNNVPSMLQSIADTPISGLNDAIQNMYIGVFLEYERTPDCGLNHEHADECYVWYDKNGNKASGMFAKMSDIKISELNKIDETLKTFTLKDVLGDNIPDMLKEFEDTEIGNLSAVLNDIYIGTAMGYLRKQITDTDNYKPLVTHADSDVKIIVMHVNGKYAKQENDGEWYEAKRDCDDSSHKDGDHTVDCFKYVWYVNDGYDTHPTGITAAFANYKVNGSGISDATKNLTIRKLGIDYGDNKLLEAIRDVKLDELGSSINDIKLGVAFGYTRGEEPISAAPSCGKEHTHSDNCYDYLWYKDSDRQKEVKGLNGKVANMTIGGMAGGNSLANIATSLTVGDLIDSGMMELQDEDKYKLNILFCQDNDLSFEASTTVTIAGVSHSISKDYHCNMADYLTYIAQSSTTDKSARGYYEKFNSHSADCAGRWKELPLKDFIDNLLSALQ